MRWRLLWFVLGFAGLTAALYWPSTPSTPQTTLPLDKVVHLLMFAVVALLGRWAGLRVGVVVAVLAAQAVLSEVLQAALLDRRGGEVADLVADLLGIALGLLVAAATGAAPATAPRGPAPPR